MDLSILTRRYNQVEPFIWYGLALMTIFALRRYCTVRERWATAGLLVAFGTSDFFESEAWWTPWWLLAWKAGCLALLLALAARARMRSRRNSARGGKVS